ncbi:MAG TPA: glycosyltransferase, partial [Bryobacteraceae bacterium]|nr:glycosyltransferase [Bryobacteraceae bacterium]
LEGWAAARPVIATPLAAEGLMAEDDHNIVLAGTAAEFASAVDRLLSDPAERERIGENGRQTYERNYTWEAAWRTLDLNPQLMLPKELNRYTG